MTVLGKGEFFQKILEAMFLDASERYSLSVGSEEQVCVWQEVALTTTEMPLTKIILRFI